MKKALSIVLTLVMALSLCTAAFAVEELVTVGQTAKVPIKARTQGEGDAGTVYSVDVEWGAMQFTYTTGDFTTWDPDTHEDTIVAAGNWFAQGNNIKVTNHSNAAVNVNIAPDQGASVDTGNGTITIAITNDAAGQNAYSTTPLQNAETFAPGNPEGADSLTAFVKLTGTYSGPENFTTVANILVSFTAA